MKEKVKKSYKLVKIWQIAAEIMDVSWYEYWHFLDSVEMTDSVHLINDKSVTCTLVSTSVLTHDMNKLQHQ